MTKIAMETDDAIPALARAEISHMLDDLSLTSFNSSPILFLTRLELIRETAHKCGYAALAEICSAFEIAMERVLHTGGADSVISNFMEIIRDAAEYTPASKVRAEPFLASVAVRLQR